MKFTEGYWIKSERATSYFASDAYFIDKVKGADGESVIGMRVVCPTKKITGRGDTLNLPTITIEFTAPGEGMIEVRAWHYEAYLSHEARFQLNRKETPVEVTITEDEAVLVNGRVAVRVDRKSFSYVFYRLFDYEDGEEHPLDLKKPGRRLTGCEYHNLAYIQYDRERSSMLPGDEYLKEDCKRIMLTELSLAPGECVYGLGERFSAFVKNGQSISTWNEDGGTSSDIAYKSIPFYMTNRGYGVFADHTGNVSYEVGSEKVEYVGMSVSGEEFRYILIDGYGAELMERYTALLGRPALPPAWSFGLWLTTSFTTNYDEATTSSFIDGMAERDIPLSVFHFDCFWMKEFHWCDFEWDERTFPDVKGMLARYHEKGLKLCAWINPYIAQGTKFFKEGVENGYLLMRADGHGVKQIDHWQAGMGLVDFTNPKAAEWYLAKLKTLLDDGIDCFKTDFGERIPTDVIYYDGSDPVSMHNYYTYLYNRAVFGLLEKEKGKNEAVLFARSATAGGQQFPVHWGGDCSANYPSMAETLRGGLSFAMSGFSFWSHDISGFEATATPDLYKRWVAFGLLSTHSRLHGSGSYRVPWLFDEESNDVVRFFTNLKCSLMPYIYAKAVEAHETGTPVMRPMIFEFAHDPLCNHLDMQYMLGDRILVAPVFDESGFAHYYLPQHHTANRPWTHLLTDVKMKGGAYVYNQKFGYFSLPLYVLPNTILARGKSEEWVGTIADSRSVWEGGKGSAEKVRPDYDYEKGTELHIYELVDGFSAETVIVNVRGEKVCTVTAERNGDVITLTSEGKVNLDGMKAIPHIEGFAREGVELSGDCAKLQLRVE